MREKVKFQRVCPAVKIPEGKEVMIEEGTMGFLVQARGGNLTVRLPDRLWQVQVNGEDLDALAKADGSELDIDPEEARGVSFDGVPDDMPEAIYLKLEECYDPEIPVNIVELGLVYDVIVEETGDDEFEVDVKMTLTAPGCGMGSHIAGEAERKIMSIPGVNGASVEVVWDPVWTPDMMNEEARQKLGM